jgi:acyl-CoA synthetase (AMP-forming)/AMP-acid ligase II
MLQARALIRHCESHLKVDSKGPEGENVSVLPLPWIMEQVYVLGWGLIARMKINFGEEPETTMADFRENGPTFVLFAPRVWEAIAAAVCAEVMDASPLKQRMFETGMQLELQALARGRRSAVADALLFRALRDRLGFSRLKSAATGGAALGPDTFRFFLAMGVPLRQLYDQTELLGAHTIHRPGEVTFDIVSVPFDPSIEIRIHDPDQNGVGEIVTRHPNMFAGYHGVAENPDLRDGWLHTGDAGYFNEAGQLVVSDRIKDIPPPAAATASRAVPRERAEILALRGRGGGARRRAVAACGDDPHSVPDRRQVDGAKSHRRHHLHRPLRQAAGAVAAAGGGGEGERLAAGAAAHPQLRAALQGARRRRRGADAHVQDPPRGDRAQVRRHYRGALPR